MDEAPIAGVMILADQAMLDRPRYKFDDGIVPLLEELREFRYGGTAVSVESGHAQQQLVLRRRQAVRPRRLFTETQKFAQLVSKPGKVMHNGE